MPLYVDLKPGDAVRIGAGTIVRAVKKKGQAMRLSIESEYRVSLEHGAPAPEKPDGARTATPFERPKRT